MKRAIVSIAVIGLVSTGLSVHASAARPSLEPTTTTFFLRTEDSACQAGFALSIEDGPDAANCGFVDAGAAQEATKLVLNEHTTARTWSARDGLPLKLDASRPISTDITLKSFQPAAPAAIGTGQAVLDVTVSAFSGGSQIIVGHGEATYLVTPGTYEYQIRFDIDIPDELQGKKIQTLDMTTVVRGPVVLHGAFSVDDPSSAISLPTLSKKAR